jgi:hypothetical protein
MTNVVRQVSHICDIFKTAQMKMTVLPAAIPVSDLKTPKDRHEIIK